MTDSEKLTLVMRYLSVADSHIHADLVSVQNSVIKSHNTYPEDILRLYKAQVRYEAFKEICTDLELILYENYGKQ